MMPHFAVGFGTWQCAGERAAETVYSAIKAGYRYIDCAYEYSNEREVGNGVARAIAERLVDRAELFIATKLWQTNHRPTLVAEQCKESLANLGLDYVDLFVVHWPLQFVPGDELYPRIDGHIQLDRGYGLQDTWKAMEQLVDSGLAKRIGVSNYCVPLLLDLLSYCRIKPFSNQIEVNVFNYQRALVEFCVSNGIVVTAYSPLGGRYAYGENSQVGIHDNPTLLELAEKYRCTPARIALSWHALRHDYHLYHVIVKASSLQRLLENLQRPVQIDASDLAAIAQMDYGLRKNDAGSVFWETPVFL